MGRNDRRQLWIILSVLVIVVGGIAILEGRLFANADPETRESMRLEAFTYTLQLLVVVVIGGGIALLYKWIERNWEASRRQRELRQHYVSRLGDAYRSIKEARRLLRASGIENSAHAPEKILTPEQIARYDEQMLVVNREQLKLEALKIESENFPLVEGSQELTNKIRQMEGYLGRIIDEYEDVRPGDTLDLAEMTRISEFTSDPDDTRDKRLGTFQRNFVRPHYDAVSLVAGRRA